MSASAAAGTFISERTDRTSETSFITQPISASAAAFSNIGHDHLDYHRDAEDYFAQKLRLFRTVLPEGATAVVNADAERSAEVIEAAYGHQLKVMTVGGKGRGIRIESVARDGFRQRIVAHHDGERFAFPLPLIGAFQASNALIAAGLAIASGSPPEEKPLQTDTVPPPITLKAVVVLGDSQDALALWLSILDAGPLPMVSSASYLLNTGRASSIRRRRMRCALM